MSDKPTGQGVYMRKCDQPHKFDVHRWVDCEWQLFVADVPLSGVLLALEKADLLDLRIVNDQGVDMTNQFIRLECND